MGAVLVVLLRDNTRGCLSYDALVNGLVSDVFAALYIQQVSTGPYNHLLGRMVACGFSYRVSWGQYYVNLGRCFQWGKLTKR